jgi:hypothetical protein
MTWIDRWLERYRGARGVRGWLVRKSDVWFVRRVMRRWTRAYRNGLLLGVLLLLGTLACGVAIQGRIDVGSEAGKPNPTSPCPQAEP